MTWRRIGPIPAMFDVFLYGSAGYSIRLNLAVKTACERRTHSLVGKGMHAQNGYHQK